MITGTVVTGLFALCGTAEAARTKEKRVAATAKNLAMFKILGTSEDYESWYGLNLCDFE